jgi:hypothetical protein
MSARRWPALVACTGLAWAVGAAAQGWPERPVRVIATHAPGSQVDTLMRVLAAKMSGSLGQPLLVENLPGAAGTLAAARVAAAKPDGHTLLVAANGHAINPALYEKLPFDTRRAFAGIGLIATVPSVIVGAPAGAATLEEFVRRARRAPGRLSYASNGVGSASHLAAELLRQRTGVDLLHVPYKRWPRRAWPTSVFISGMRCSRRPTSRRRSRNAWRTPSRRRWPCRTSRRNSPHRRQCPATLYWRASTLSLPGNSSATPSWSDAPTRGRSPLDFDVRRTAWDCQNTSS